MLTFIITYCPFLGDRKYFLRIFIKKLLYDVRGESGNGLKLIKNLFVIFKLFNNLKPTLYPPNIDLTK